MPDRDPATIARRFVAEVLDGDQLHRAAELVAPGVVVHAPTRDEPLVGLDALLGYIRSFRAALSDLSFRVEDVLADGDRVALRLTVAGTHSGELFGIAATGLRVSVPEVLILRVSGGLIVEDWVQADLLGLRAKLAAAAPPG